MEVEANRMALAMVIAKKISIYLEIAEMFNIPKGLEPEKMLLCHKIDEYWFS